MKKYSSPNLRLENPGQPHSLHLFYPIPAYFQITHPCAQYFSKLVKCICPHRCISHHLTSTFLLQERCNIEVTDALVKQGKFFPFREFLDVQATPAPTLVSLLRCIWFVHFAMD